MKQIPHLTYGEQFALDEWLSKYPENMAYADILKLIAESDWSNEDFFLWDIFENIPMSQIADFIDETREHFDYVVGSTLHD